MILNISPKTVNYHVEKAKKRFGVTTRIQAVMTAMRLGVL
jgi:DNA-binding CsgD family transcriptional regulator